MIAEHLLSTFGENAFAMIVDEGGLQPNLSFRNLLLNGSFRLGGFQDVYGSVVALPSVTEKGYLDIQLTVTSPGGHSSVPPKHTVRAHESFSQ